MTNAEKIYEENRNHCKAIAEDIELYISGDGYKCPICGCIDTFDAYEERKNEDNETFCPHCGGMLELSELEAISIYDYFDDVFDIEYRVSSDKTYRSVCVMVACGGPNIYIDTASKLVRLHWWTDYADYPLSYEAVNEIDAYFEELFNC